jgi:hypothetical protein
VKHPWRVVGVVLLTGGVAMGFLQGEPGVVTAGVTAQLTTPDGWEVPRTPWGDPDLRGIWDSKSTTPLERPEEYADREFLSDEEIAALEAARDRLADEGPQGRDVRAAPGTEADVEGAYNNIFSTFLDTAYSRTKRTSLIVDPPSGRLPPLTAEAAAQREAASRLLTDRREAAAEAGVPYTVDVGRSYDNPEDVRVIERCQGVTLPCTGGLCGFSRLAQGPDSVAIYYEQGHGGGAYRSIPLDGRPHLPGHIRQWLGDSVGHWAGDTLVVDTTNFTDQTSYLGAAENLYLVERFTRLGPDLLKYEVTVEDQTVWTRPWTMELALTLQDNTQNLIFEAACHEGNYSLTAMLAGARLEEAVAEPTEDPSDAATAAGAR